MKKLIVMLLIFTVVGIAHAGETFKYEKISKNIVQITKTETFDSEVTPDNTRIIVLKTEKARLEQAKIDAVKTLDAQRAETIADYDASIALISEHISGAIKAGVEEEAVINE